MLWNIIFIGNVVDCMWVFFSFQFLHCTLCMVFRSSVKLRYLFIEKHSFTISSYPFNNLTRLVIVFQSFILYVQDHHASLNTIFFTVNEYKCICKNNNYMLQKFVNLQCTLYHAVYYIMLMRITIQKLYNSPLFLS